VFREQGYGDIIQFARYLPLLRQAGASVSFLLSLQLARLLRSVTAGVTIISELKSADAFDFQCALMSLPHWFRTDLGSVPAVPFLSAEEELVARWKSRIGEHGFKIGIAWQGNPKALERTRFIPLAQFAPLARIPQVRLISLQYKDGLDQLDDLPSDVKVEILGGDFNSGPDAFVDTAAVIANLDLIISCDTSIPHLAGALGRRTWIALKQVPDWRWMLEREDSPWYPTVRLFRQPERGDWNSVFKKIEQELRSLLAPHAPAASSTARVPIRSGPNIQVSWGDLFDRISLLEGELTRPPSPTITGRLHRELAALCAATGHIELERPEIATLKAELRIVNETLGRLDIALRAKTDANVLDRELIELARSIQLYKDRRMSLKRAIDRLLNAEPDVGDYGPCC
jgi:hypothetical protein